MRGNAHVRFGGRRRADHRARARHGGPPPTLHRDRPLHAAQREALARRDMRKRWTAAGMLVAEQQFRRIIGYRDLAKLVIAIERHALLVADQNRDPQEAREPVTV